MKRVLDFVQTEKQWSYIAEFWVELCEIAPDIILDRLYKELESTTGLLELFVKQTSDFIFSRNPYVDILWGVEQFLVQKKYFWRGFRWLLELDKKGYTFTSNSPKDTFSKIFCIWHNFSALETAEEKIKAAEIAIEQDEETAWNYIFDSIDNNGGSIIGELSSPKYREHKIPRDTTNRDMYEARHAYLNILLSHMDFSTKRWEKIIDLTENMTDELRQEIFDKLLQDICHMSDLDVITIKNHIRQIIYRHRYYSSSSWAMSEENVIVYEELLNRIYSKVPEYEFGYLFTPRWDLALLHPIPYGSNNEDKSNEKIKQKIIQEQINVFQKNGYSIFVLAELLARESYSPLGLYLAEYWNNGEWDFDLFTELLSAQKSGQFAIDYLRSSTKDDVSLYPEIINKLLRIGCTDEVLAQVYRCEASKTKKLPLITNEKEHIKKIFWQSSIFCDDCNVYWAIHEAKKYGMLNVFLEQIFDSHHKKPFSALDIFEFFEDVEKVPYSSSNQMTGYYADSLLEVLQDSFLDNPDRCMRVVQLEIYFSNLIDWNHMKCFHHVIKVSPELFAQLIAIVFRRDDGKSSNKETSELVIQNTYSLYQKTHFCPTEENGNVYEEKLEQWIEKFRDLLEGNNQVSLLSSILGRLFSFSPLGSDGHEPCEAVRKMIEKYGDEEMIQSYRTSVYNRRGVFSPSAGKEEMEMAKEFLRNAEFLAPNYPNTAKVFYELSESYIRESEQARKDAENGW